MKLYDGGKSDFPYYDSEKSERRISVNRVVVELAKLDLLSFEWMKGERDHIIAKVWLNTDRLIEYMQKCKADDELVLYHA